MKKRKANKRVIQSSSDDESNSKIQASLVAEINSDLSDNQSNSIVLSENSDVKDSTLWIDRYPPYFLTDLAVHKKKIEQVMSWMESLKDMTPKVWLLTTL